jgi:ribosomal protein L14E/L6E/L27E
MTPGQIVYVKKGRDKGSAMIVLAVTQENKALYVHLTNGSSRPLSKPKKKKAMHVQPTNTIIDLARATPCGLQDANIRKMLGDNCKGKHNTQAQANTTRTGEEESPFGKV